MSINLLLQQINETHHTTFSLLNRYADGEQGAFSIQNATGNCFVLKCQPRTPEQGQIRFIQDITASLRAQSYPAPRFTLNGHTSVGSYTIQTALPGTPMQQLTEPYLPQVLSLLDLHKHQASDGMQQLSTEVINTILYGGQGYCQHTALQQHSRAGADMLDDLQHIVTTHMADIPSGNDIVHFDFQPYNLLVQDQHISGVIDWEGVCAGDGAFDLATLLFYAYDNPSLREQLWHHAQTRTSFYAFSIYLAHMILRQIDWSLRHHDAATIERYFVLGQSILADIKMQKYQI